MRTPRRRCLSLNVGAIGDRPGAQIGATRLGPSVGLWLCLALAALVWPQQATAWGDYGHKIVCEIAFQELGTATRERVKALIRLDPEFRYFSDSCVWPDHPRRRNQEHFVNIPRSVVTVRDANCPLSDRCLFTAIENETRILGDPRSNNQQKLAALKFLGHWVGDIHQPLHVAFEDDRGGNSIREDGPQRLSLHKVWDQQIIASGLQGSVRQVAAKLRRSVTHNNRTAWLDSTAADWAQESYAIATSAATGYCVRKEDACWYGPATLRYKQGDPQRTIRADARYLDSHLPAVINRLRMSGVRLANILGKAFD